MNLVNKAYKLLYNKELDKKAAIKYSGKFRPYNANVHITRYELIFNLSKTWKDVDEQIKIGLIQHLLMKIYKKKQHTTNIDLYMLFIKQLPSVTPAIYSNPELKESFDRVNKKYFFNIIEMPNLKWGNKTLTQLGAYNYHTDTITISSVFKNHPRLIDYVMYHEMLHKKHSFKSNKGRSYYHTHQFRKDEKQFEDIEQIEKEIDKLTAKPRTRLKFGFF